MKRILGILICLFFCVGVTFAQKVSDVTARQVGKQIHISYTLDEPAEISLYLSTDGGESYIKLIKVSGAVGQFVSPGRNTIVWNVLEERENLVGDNIVFKVRAEDATTVTDIDGNVYRTVKLGNQVWMAENLRTTRYANGTSIALGTGIDYDVAYRYYPDGNNVNVSDYGYLYNWPAVMNGANSSNSNPSGVQGICPNGWHVPSDAEWTELENYVKSQSQYVCGGDVDYIAKALASEKGWKSGTKNCAVGNNPDANNATFFSVRPAGIYSGYYFYFGCSAYFWSSTQSGSYYAYNRYLRYGNANVARNDRYKDIGYSVRCVCN